MYWLDAKGEDGSNALVQAKQITSRDGQPARLDVIDVFPYGDAVQESRMPQGPTLSVASLTGRELGDAADILALGKAASDWYRANLIGQEVTNAETGWSIRFSRRAANKIGGRKGEDLYRIVHALREIIGAGRLLSSEPALDPDSGIKMFYKFWATVSLNGVSKDVVATVREDATGKYHYNLSLNMEDGARWMLSPRIPVMEAGAKETASAAPELKIDFAQPTRKRNDIPAGWEVEDAQESRMPQGPALAVASLTGRELGDAADILALGKAASEWYRADLIGQEVTNAETGWAILFSRKAANKIGGRKGEDLYRIVPALREMIAKGRLVSSEPFDDPDGQTRAFHKFAVVVGLAGVVKDVIVTVRESANGRYHYDLNRDMSDGARFSLPSSPVMDAGARGEVPTVRAEYSAVDPALEGGPVNLDIEFREPAGKREDAPQGWGDVDADPPITDAAIASITRDLNAELARSGLAGKASVRMVKGLTNAAGIKVQGLAAGSAIRVDPDAPAGALGTMRHEIIHVTRNAALWGKPYGLYTAEEWRGLVAEARRDKATVARVAVDYKDQPPIVQTEETVAEMYRLWMAKRDKQGPVAATLRKIMGFLEAVANALRGRGFQSAARTMERIARGDVGRREPDGGAPRDSAGRFVTAEAREAARDTEFAARIMAELAQVDDLFQNPLATGATLKAVFRCLIPDFDGAILSSEWRDAAVEALDLQIAQEAIRAVTTTRQIALDQYDEGELTAAERDAEMDVLDNQIVQMAMGATKKARNAVLIRYDDGELTAAERDAELGSLDYRFAQMLHAGAIPPVGQTDLQSERWPLSPSARTVHDDGIEVRLDGLSRLQSAAADFAKTESTRIVRAVIEDMRDRPAQGTFGEVAARHMWDEYCWALQEGPFDDDEGWDDVRLGSLSGAFDEMVRILIEVEIDRLPHHAQVFLSSKAIDDDFDMEEDALGTVWMHGMVDLVLEELNRQAARRSLYLIGPDRASVIGSEVEGSGIVWSVMSDRREATDIVASHVDEMIDPKSDLSMLAEEMVDAFLAAAKDEVDETVAAGFFDRFEDQIREMLTEHDVLPDLEDMRAQLQEQMDR